MHARRYALQLVRHPVPRIFHALGHLVEGFGFDLANAFAGQAELLADFFERPRLVGCRGRTASAARWLRADPSWSACPSRGAGYRFRPVRRRGSSAARPSPFRPATSRLRIDRSAAWSCRSGSPS